MPARVKARVRQALDQAAAEMEEHAELRESVTRRRPVNRIPASPRSPNLLWWAGTGVVAAALIAFVVIGALGKGIGPIPPIQPTSQGAGRYVASSEPIVNIQMVNAQVGWAASLNGNVLRTQDGGATWRDVSPVDLPKAAAGTTPTVPVFLPDDSQAAWLLDMRTDTVYRTVDGGKHWQKGTPPKLDIANDGGVSMSFASQNQGWLMVSGGTHSQIGQLFKTANGGLTWQPVSQTVGGNSGSTGGAASAGGNGTGANGNGLPYGGHITFSRVVSGLGWLRPDFQANSNGMPPLYETRDGGKTWAPLQLTLPDPSTGYTSNQVYVQLPQFASRNTAKHGPAQDGLEGMIPVTLMNGRSNMGLLYITTDGGTTWNLGGLLSNVGSSTALITSISDSLTFFAYVPDGNTLWATQDGAKTWTLRHPEPSLYDYQPVNGTPLMTRINFVSWDQGWAAVNGALFRTADGGRTWTALGQAANRGPGPQPGGILSVGTAVKEVPQDLVMFDQSHGYGSVDGHPIMTTVDGGATWTDVTPRNLAGNNTDIVKGYFIDAKTGWAFNLHTAQDVTVYGTKDGGRSWSKLAAPPVKYGDGNMFVTFSDAAHGWMLVRTAGMGQLAGELLATTDGGQTWTRVAETGAVNTSATGAPGDLPFGGDITAQADGTLWLSGSQRATGGGSGFLYLFKSTDGGKSWTQVSLPKPAGREQDTTNVSNPAFFGKSGFVSVTFVGQTTSASVLYATTDSGQTWSLRNPSNIGGWPVFANPNLGWETDGQKLFGTSDGGGTWREVPADASLQNVLAGRTIWRLVFPNFRSTSDGQVGLMILNGWSKSGNAGSVLLVTDDGGQTWSSVGSN